MGLEILIPSSVLLPTGMGGKLKMPSSCTDDPGMDINRAL